MVANGNKTNNLEVETSLSSQYFQSQFHTDNHIPPNMQPPSAVITYNWSTIYYFYTTYSLVYNKES